MESNHVDDQSENSNEDNNAGVGRSYECVFCKRGFTTAQALGGHMNIHRKDKAKNKPTTTTSNKHDQENNYTGPRVYQQIFASHEAQLMNYHTFFPASSTSSRSSSAKSLYDENHCNNSRDPNEEGLNPYGDDRKLSFSLQFGAELVENMGKMSNDKKQENDLDLELRLGPDP